MSFFIYFSITFMLMFIFHFFFMFHIIFMFSCSSMNLLYLIIGIIPIDSSKFNLWHFHANSHFIDFTLGTFCINHFSGVLTSFLDTMSLYSFKSKVLRVLFQLESPNSEHRHSRYDLDTRDYSMLNLKQNLT